MKQPDFINQIKEFFAGVANWPLWYWAIVLGILMLIIAWIISRGNRRKRKLLEANAPRLLVEQLHIAPLGRDAFVKVRNVGPDTTLTGLSVYGRKGLIIKNQVAGHRLPQGKTYSLMFETDDKAPITSDFFLDLTFIDQSGHTFQQRLPVAKHLLPTEPSLVR